MFPLFPAPAWCWVIFSFVDEALKQECSQKPAGNFHFFKEMVFNLSFPYSLGTPVSSCWVSADTELGQLLFLFKFMVFISI
jgi:hypothetical protein